MKYCFLSLFLLMSVIVTAQSKYDQAIGEKTYDLVVKSMGIYKDTSLQRMVEETGKVLEKQLNLGYPLKYFLVDSPDPNAFATGGGYVYITRGLLAIVNTRDELAGIMAHELSHVTKKHVIKKIGVRILPLLLELPGNIIGLLTYEELGSIINFPIDATLQIGVSAFDRSQEIEADEAGVELAIKSGYDPYGLVNALERLTADYEFLTGKPMPRNIYIDHPVTESRVKNLTKLITGKGFSRKENMPGTNLTALNGLVYGQNPLGGIVKQSKFIHPKIGLYFDFPDKWDVQNIPISVAGTSPNKKSTIIVTADTSGGSVYEVASKVLSSLKNTSLLRQDTTRVNGLEAFRATIRKKQVKYEDLNTELMWIKFPGSGVIIQVAGVSSFNNPDTTINKCFNTFRQIEDSDLHNLEVANISLVEIKEWKGLDPYLRSGINTEEERKRLSIINGISEGQAIPAGRYVKVLQSNPVGGK